MAKFEFELLPPESAYLAAFLKVHEKFSMDRDTGVVFWPECWRALVIISLALPEVVCLASSIVCQVAFTFYLDSELAKVDACDVNLSVGLKYVGAAVFIGHMMQEFMQVMTFFMWMLSVKGVDYPEGTKASELWIRDRVGGILFIVMPQFAIVLYLSWVGTRFVLMSENDTELILNCVAMTFVTQVDELLYGTASSQATKKLTKNLKAHVVPSVIGAVIDVMIAPVVKIVLWIETVHVFIQQLPQCTMLT